MDSTTTFVDPPDILRPQMLERAVDVEVETNILEPVSHQYTSRDGGHTRWVFPAKAVLNAPNAAMVFEIVNGEIKDRKYRRRYRPKIGLPTYDWWSCYDPKNDSTKWRTNPFSN